MYCCINGVTGVPGSIEQGKCLAPANAKCGTYTDSTTSPPTVTYGCAPDSVQVIPGVSVCTTDFCNCPSDGTVHKTFTAVGWFFGDMRRIMYPIMGMIFAVLWVILAFFGGGPVDIVLLIVAIIDLIFGILLIFLPVTTYLGLFYCVLAALTIAVVKHDIGGKFGLIFVILLTCLIFLLTGGLTWIAGSGNYFDLVASYPSGCESNMNIVNWDNLYQNLDTRCEHFALFIGFCVFLLFLVQPIALIALFFKKSGGGGGFGGGGHHGGNKGDNKGDNQGHAGGSGEGGSHTTGTTNAQ